MRAAIGQTGPQGDRSVREDPALPLLPPGRAADYGAAVTIPIEVRFHRRQVRLFYEEGGSAGAADGVA